MTPQYEGQMLLQNPYPAELFAYPQTAVASGQQFDLRSLPSTSTWEPRQVSYAKQAKRRMHKCRDIRMSRRAYCRHVTCNHQSGILVLLWDLDISKENERSRWVAKWREFFLHIFVPLNEWSRFSKGADIFCKSDKMIYEKSQILGAQTFWIDFNEFVD